jgi:glycosyltransferase involved in cell wall biosynthesis
MKIAQVAPLYEAVPPLLYGGTERVIHYLTEELVKEGHEVTLFASGDSVTNAALVAPVQQALRLDPVCVDPLAHHIIEMDEVMRRSDQFDIIHFHTDYLHFPFSSRCNTPCVTTLHGRLDIADLQPLYRQFPRQPVISISNDQRKPLPTANWMGTVYHGLPVNLHPLRQGKGEYLAFIGRVSPEKGLDRAIEIAVQVNYSLKIAAKIDRVDRHYYEKQIAHLMNHPLIEFVGEINDEQKTSFLGNARALLFPVDWAEPFGLVMIEAMSCGTPVIAFNRGSVPEVIEDGVTGFIVGSVHQAVEAFSRIHELSRTDVRRVFEQRFTAKRMAADYLQIYRLVIDNYKSEPLSLSAGHHR